MAKHQSFFLSTKQITKSPFEKKIQKTKNEIAITPTIKKLKTRGEKKNTKNRKENVK